MYQNKREATCLELASTADACPISALLSLQAAPPRPLLYLHTDSPTFQTPMTSAHALNAVTIMATLRFATGILVAAPALSCWWWPVAVLWLPGYTSANHCVPRGPSCQGPEPPWKCDDQGHHAHWRLHFDADYPLMIVKSLVIVLPR